MREVYRNESGSHRPIVSVIIPTANRPEMLKRAVRSALEQDIDAVEVIVVIDGSEPNTVAELRLFGDSRLRVIEVGTRRGGGFARNVGIMHARGDWIALLDDDDEWMRHKLRRQLDAANRVAAPYPIMASRLIARTPQRDYIWPRRPIGPQEPAADYLFARSSLFQGEGLLQTSTLLARKQLFELVPFRELPRHQDWDWLIRASAREGVVIEIIDEPLAIWYREEHRSTVSGQRGWRFSLTWARELRPLFTPRAYAAFMLTVVASLAARERDWKALVPVISEAVRRGEPSLMDWILFLGLWTIPRNLRRMLRRAFSSDKPMAV